MGKLHIKSKAAALLLAGLMLCGCSSGTDSLPESSKINIIDAGGGNSDETPHTSRSETDIDTSGAEFMDSAETSDTYENTASAQAADPPAPPVETIPAITIPEQPIETTGAPPEPIIPSFETEETGEIVSSEPTDTNEGTELPETAESTETAAETITDIISETESFIETKPTAETEIPIEPETHSYPQNSYAALNYADVKGVWISYIELSEILQGKSETEFTNAISTAFDNIVDYGLNTVYVHMRSHGDAYYKSELYPWSKYASGKTGMSPGFDPLEIMLEEAHERSLSFQAWINPLRACGTSEISGQRGYLISDWANSIATAGKYVVPVNGMYYLNPAYDEVIKYIADGAAEICSNYNVDGVHIDDYFYPTTDESFDADAFSGSGYETISAFRFANCDNLVRSLYGAVKSANPSALFGVSCQGSIDNNYNLMYADVKKWCSESGYLDYICPQMYYGFKHSLQPYENCASQWDTIASVRGIPMIAGLSVSKIGIEDKWAGVGKNEWITDTNILARQLNYAKELRSFGGVCLYSYRNLFTPDSSVQEKTEEEKAALKSVL